MTTPHVSVCYRPGQFALPARYTGHPADRLASTPGDNLAEFSGRLCYGSLNKVKGRPTPEYHTHIRETRHHSVYAHAVETFHVRFPSRDWVSDGVRGWLAYTLLGDLTGRPGVWVTRADEDGVRFSASLRAVIEWEAHGAWNYAAIPTMSAETVTNVTGRRLADILRTDYPLTLAGVPPVPPRQVGAGDAVVTYTRVPAELPQEKWASLYIEGVSRDMCYTPGTEVLTREGWSPVEKLKAGDMLLTKDPTSGQSRWSVNHRLVTMTYDGPVHWFENTEWASPRMTPDHVVWVGRYDLRRCRGLSSREIMDRYAEKTPLDGVLGSRFVVDHQVVHTGVDPATMTIGDHTYDAELLFEWFGWVVTDGGCNSTRKRIYVTQSKPQGVTRLRELFKLLFAERYRELDYTSSGQSWVGKIHDHAMWTFITSHFGRLKPKRRLTFLFDFSPRLIKAFLRGAEGGDGSVNHSAGDHLVLHCPYRPLADDYQALYALAGRSACLRNIGPPVGTAVTIRGIASRVRVQGLAVSVHKGTTSLVTAKYQKEMNYSGPVYCPQTDDGLVYVRREGHGVWCGNCQELARHHYQANPSVRSTRYVDESDSFAVPHPALEILGSLPDIADPNQKPNIRNEIDEHFVWTRQLYRDVFTDLRDKGVDEKTARGAARSVLPGATETRLVFSLSEFQARHLLSLRANQATGAVDPEIGRLAGLMREALRAEGWDV